MPSRKRNQGKERKNRVQRQRQQQERQEREQQEERQEHGQQEQDENQQLLLSQLIKNLSLKKCDHGIPPPMRAVSSLVSVYEDALNFIIEDTAPYSRPVDCHICVYSNCWKQKV